VQATSSITIQRHPLRKINSREKSTEEATSSHDSALPENHKPAPKSADRGLAASVLPNIKPSSEGGRSAIEVVPTQTAMARLIQRIEPEYPNAARQQHIQGTVLLDVVVNPDGTVDGLSMVSGESQLMAAAAQAVKQWRFQPIMKHGKAVKFETRIPIDFILALEGSGSN
jgi:TonB family protein